MKEVVDGHRRAIRGRGSGLNPPNRFERLALEPVEDDEAWESGDLPVPVRTIYYEDHSREILSKNNSPDLPFEYSLNPYRGCEHGCVYCYARPTHEYLGFSSGLDFESRIVVKRDAPRLLEERLRSRSWSPQVILMSGVTDCYQPIERRLGLTRACLEVFLRCGNPVSVITKSALVLRDLDLLRALARRKLVRVTLSITTLDPVLARRMEPRAATPARRLEAVEQLAQAGVPCGVNVAPVIPGLNDHEIAPILAQAAAGGASRAGYVLLRLPYSVKELFQDWLRRHYPHREHRVIRALQSARSGRLSDPRFHSRMRGQGARARLIEQLFRLHCARLGLNQAPDPLVAGPLQACAQEQLELFGG